VRDSAASHLAWLRGQGPPKVAAPDEDDDDDAPARAGGSAAGGGAGSKRSKKKKGGQKADPALLGFLGMRPQDLPNRTGALEKP
jgi:hypothetical protein